MKKKEGGLLRNIFRGLTLLLLLFVSLKEISMLLLNWAGTTVDYLLFGLFLIPAVTAVPFYFKVKPFQCLALVSSLAILSINIYRLTAERFSTPSILTSIALLVAIILLFSLIRAEKV